MAIPIGFLEALPSAQKASDLADADSIFDWLIGSWEMDAVLHDADGREHRTKGRCTRLGYSRGEPSRTSSFSHAEGIARPACPHAATDIQLRSERSTES